MHHHAHHGRRKSAEDVIGDVLQRAKGADGGKLKNANDGNTATTLTGNTVLEKRTLFRNPTLADSMLRQELRVEKNRERLESALKEEIGKLPGGTESKQVRDDRTLKSKRATLDSAAVATRISRQRRKSSISSVFNQIVDLQKLHTAESPMHRAIGFAVKR